MTELTKNILNSNGIELIASDEVFYKVPGWRKYFASNYGRLIHKNNKGRYHIVNPSINRGGYLTYTLSKPARTYRGEKVKDKNGVTKTIRICKGAQQMVAIIFVDNPYPDEYHLSDLQVHHKDRNRFNNYYKNLMWLCKSKNGRTDHNFIHKIKKVSLYNEDTAKFRGYNDIDQLLRKIGVNVLEFIDGVRYGQHIKSQDGRWDVYSINGYYVGVQFFKGKSAGGKKR